MNHLLVLLLSFVFLCGTSAHNERGPERGWVKLNGCGKEVCFQGMKNRPGKFKSEYAGFLAAVKLVHKSGEIRCNPDPKYISFFGCYNYPSLTDYPLNVVVTNSKNKIKFPTSGINRLPGKNPAFWYGMDGVHSRSKEIVLQHSFDTPYYVNVGQVLKVWYAEDLKNTWDSNNLGKVCVDVYGYLI